MVWRVKAIVTLWKTVAITRPIDQAEELADLINSKGGTSYIASTVEIQPVTRSPKIRKFINQMKAGRIGLIVFMSQNAVTSLIGASSNMGLQKNLLAELRRSTIMTIGERPKKP